METARTADGTTGASWLKTFRPKEFLLASICIASAALLGYFWVSISSLSDFSDSYRSLGAGIALFLFSSSFVLLTVATESKLLLWPTLLLSAIAIYIWHPFSKLFVFGAVFFLVFALWIVSNIRRDLNERTVIRWNAILKNGLSHFFTACAILFSVLYFSLLAPQTKITDVFIPKKVFNGLVSVLQNPIQAFLPGFQADATIDDVILQFAVKEFGSGIDISQIPPQQLQQLLVEGRANLSKQLGTKVSGKEKAGDALYSVANQYVEKYAKPYKQYIPYVLAIGYFGILKFVLYLFSLLFRLVFPFLVWLLIFIGFLKKEYITIQKETIRL